jgi:uncharacterized protein YbcI
VNPGTEIREAPHRFSLGEDISRTFVQLMKEYGGKGPTRCKTYIDGDLVVVLMRGGFNRAEQTLFEDGKWLDVRNSRHAIQDTMAGRLTDTLEGLTGRTVSAFMSASHQAPDLQVEMFLLDAPAEPAGPPQD